MKENKIVIIDDHEIVRKGLATALAKEKDFKIIGSFRSASEFLEGHFRDTPDLVILDLRLPGENGVMACEKLVRKFPGARIVILTAFSDEDALHRCLISGAGGFLLKDIDIKKIRENLKKIAAGEHVIDSRMMGSLIDRLRFSSQAKGKADLQLSDFEMELIKHVAQGLSNRDIGKITDRSTNTIKFYVSKIMKKLNVHKRSAMVNKANKMMEK